MTRLYGYRPDGTYIGVFESDPTAVPPYAGCVWPLIEGPHQPTQAELSQIADDWAEERTDPGYRGWRVPGTPKTGPRSVRQGFSRISALTDHPGVSEAHGIDWDNWDGDDN